MVFPVTDQPWVEAANFMTSHLQDGEHLIALSEFEEQFGDQTYSYSDSFNLNGADIQWAVIHKGLIDDIDTQILKYITKEFRPVFANEVFVIFSSNKQLAEVRYDSPHILSFWETVRSIHGPGSKTVSAHILNLGMSTKNVIKKVPVVNKLAKRVYQHLLTREWRRISGSHDSNLGNPKPTYESAAKAEPAKATTDYSSLHVEEIKKLMDERFRKGQAYNNTCLWDEVRGREIERQVNRLISPTKGKKILEIGCGVTGSAPYVSDCAEYIGTDLSEEAISQAQKEFGNRPNYKFLPMDAMHLKFEDNYFDLVLAKEVIEHLPGPQKSIKEAFRVLKPSGMFIVTSPNRDSLHLRVNRMLGYKDFKCSNDHVKEFRFQEAVEMLSKEGFAIKETAGIFLQPYWGIPGIDAYVRHLTDSDPQMVAMLRDLGERAGADYAFCYLIVSIKPDSNLSIPAASASIN